MKKKKKKVDGVPTEGITEEAQFEPELQMSMRFIVIAAEFARERLAASQKASENDILYLSRFIGLKLYTPSNLILSAFQKHIHFSRINSHYPSS